MSRFSKVSRSVAVALVATATLLLTACGGSTGKDYQFNGWTSDGRLIPAADRKPAEDVGGTLLSGGKVSLSQYRGKVVVVTFWASWCGPCTVETPQYSLMYDKLKGDGITVLGINTHNIKSAAQSFVSGNHISFPNVYDPDGSVLLKLGNPPGDLPITMVVDKQQRVAAAYLGAQFVKTIQPALLTLAAEKSGKS